MNCDGCSNVFKKGDLHYISGAGWTNHLCEVCYEELLQSFEVGIE